MLRAMALAFDLEARCSVSPNNSAFPPSVSPR